MQAGFGEVDQLCGCFVACWLDFETVDTIQEGARVVSAIGVLVRQWRAVVFGVPAFARNHASVAADTGVEVNDEAQFLLGG